MTTHLVAQVQCDCCPAELVIDESALHARNSAMVARQKGWGHRNGLDLCPSCLQVVLNPQGVLALEGP